MEFPRSPIKALLESGGIYSLRGTQQLTSVVELVAEIPWGEGRTIEDVLITRKVGTCTGKHLVLQACLDELGIKYRPVVCTFRWEKQGIKYPRNLRRILDEGGWKHGHNFVQIAGEGGKYMDIDITWNSKLKPFGFRTFPRDWDGKSPFIGLDEMVRRWDDANIVSMKKEFVDSLTPEVRERRERFLKGFIDWVGRINKG
ncbi:MAG: hypothetical protein V1813_03635 [Candidatus Aenigmatarchaeota archaeon]